MSASVSLLSLLLFPAFQGVPQRAVLDKSLIQVDPEAHEPAQVVVKFAEGSNVRLKAGRLVSPARVDLSRVQDLVANRRIESFFAGLERELATVQKDIEALQPAGARPGPDLQSYYLVSSNGHDDSRRLIARLNALDIVELAYPKERPSPPPGDIPPPTPDFTGLQAWQAAAPSGFDMRAIRQLTGAWGKGLAVLDIEWGWWFDHEDIAGLRASSLKGPPLSRTAYNHHGTAVIGEIASDPDQFGVTGMTPDVGVLCVTDYPATGYSVARAILTGLPFLQKGDVMLLEAQTWLGTGRLGPTEWNQADFDAIVTATKKGVIVVEAAGNGGQNLDDPKLGGAFELTKRDSGAIIVGASEGSSLTRAGFSCYGSRIDANGWGLNVVTTGYGDLFNPNSDHRQRYTRVFSGTSSASPMVTSTVVALLAGAKAQWSPQRYDRMVDHKEIRRLLRTYGTSLTGQGIGLRPDLDKLLKGAGLIRGMQIQGDAKIGKSFRLQITADFAAGAGDAWLLFAAPRPANLAVGGLASPCDRLLLDVATLFPVVAGNFASGKTQTVDIVVPNDTALKLARFYWQALTLRGSDLRFCLTSGSMSFIMP